MNKHCDKYWRFNKEQIQSIVSAMCGYYCCQFVIFMEKYRNDFNRMLRLYTNDTALNDVIVYKFMRAIQ